MENPLTKQDLKIFKKGTLSPSEVSSLDLPSTLLNAPPDLLTLSYISATQKQFPMYTSSILSRH